MTRSIGSRMTQDRSAPKARAISPPSHRNTRGKSGLERDLRPHARFRDDGEECGLAIVDQPSFGGERRKRGFRRRVHGRSEEGEHDSAAGKGIEGQSMAPCIEEKGGVARLGAGLQRKVALFGHRFPVDSVV